MDGSANSLRALAIACQRTRGRRGATVVALNVQPAMPPSRFSPREAIRDHHERMAAEVFQKVAVVAKREKIRVQQEMVVGLPAETIVRQATEHRADEIVMGTRGLGGVKWPAAGFTDTWIRWMMRLEVADGNAKGIHERVQG